MVRAIYITENKNFNQPKKVISSLQDYGKSSKLTHEDEYIDAFDDYTLNFEDLLYWNSEKDLHNKTIEEVLDKLSNVINKLKEEGTKKKDYEPDFLLPEWWFGNRKSANSCVTIPLSNEEKKPIILLHLIQMYDLLQEINNKDSNKEYYCHLELYDY